MRYEAMLQGDSLLNPAEPMEVMWPSLGKIEFSKDEWTSVVEEQRGEHHAAEDYLFVDEVACTNCLICVDAAPNTFQIVDYPGGDDNCGGGKAARVHTQWGDGEELLLEATEYCPRSCIHWVPRTAVRTLEYVSQADDNWPCPSVCSYDALVVLLFFVIGLHSHRVFAACLMSIPTTMRSSSHSWERSARISGQDQGRPISIQ